MESSLRASTRFPPPAGPVVVAILDGVGVGRGDAWDAVAIARTPVLDELRASSPYRTLRAHGTAVGLPSDDDMGNSEVGHNALGAGRVIDQGAKLVNAAIADGSIFRTDVWRRIGERCRGGGALHLIGLLSDGNVHSHQDHLHALVEEARRENLRKVHVHVLLDGRDVPPQSALQYVDRLESLLAACRDSGGGEYGIASGGGRMVTTMDRYEADWRIVERGWNAHVHGKAREFRSAGDAIRTFRQEQPEIGDQFLPPFVVADDRGPVGAVRDGDSVVFFNFRGDRALEISRAFEGDRHFSEFDRGRVPEVLYAGMTLYDGDLRIPKTYLVPPPVIDRTVGEYLARTGVTQMAISETQKFGHVTYFWNGNRSGKFDEGTEAYVEIRSDRVPFEQRPWMKAAEIVDRTVRSLRSRKAPRLVRLNFANGDMVGHTGHLGATVVAVETVDLCLGRLVPVVDAVRGTLVVLADHGNADDMVERDDSGQPKMAKGRPVVRTSHSLNPVPFLIHRQDGRALRLRDDLPAAGLANVAATLVELLGYEPPDGYEPSLLA